MSHLRRKAAFAAVGAVAISGFFLSSPAYAAKLGNVTVESTNLDESLSWGKGWDACRAKYPSTKSIESTGNIGSEGKYKTFWRCYDTATY